MTWLRRSAAVVTLVLLCGAGARAQEQTYAGLTAREWGQVLVEDGWPGVRRLAAWVLWEIGPEARAALPALGRALEDPDARVRELAARALFEVSKGSDAAQPLVGALAAGLRDSHPPVRTWCGAALADLGPKAAPALEALHAAARESGAGQREAITALGRIGEPARSAAPALVGLLEGRDGAQVKAAAAVALSRIGGPDAAAAVPKLLELARAPRATGELKAGLVEALGRLDGDDPQVLELLVASLGDRVEEVREGASAGLAAAGAAALPALTAGLDATNAGVRVASIAALGDMGAPAAPALERLQALNTPGTDALVAATAIEAVKKIRGEWTPADAVPALDERVRRKDWKALARLGELGPVAEPAVPTLMGLLGKGQAEAAVDVLVQIGRPAVPALIAGLKAEGEVKAEAEKTRKMAARALGRLGVKAEPAIPALAEALRDGHPFVRQQAGESLVGIGGGAVAALVEALEPAERVEVRQLAAEMLGKLGLKAKAALPALEEAAKDADYTLKRNAEAALQAIRRELGPG